MRRPKTRKKFRWYIQHWAIRTVAHYQVVVNLSEWVWGEIHEASSAVGLVDVDATADESEIEDSEDLVQLLSEPEVTRLHNVPV